MVHTCFPLKDIPGGWSNVPEIILISDFILHLKQLGLAASVGQGVLIVRS